MRLMFAQMASVAVPSPISMRPRPASGCIEQLTELPFCLSGEPCFRPLDVIDFAEPADVGRVLRSALGGTQRSELEGECILLRLGKSTKRPLYRSSTAAAFRRRSFISRAAGFEPRLQLHTRWHCR